MRKASPNILYWIICVMLLAANIFGAFVNRPGRIANRTAIRPSRIQPIGPATATVTAIP